MSSYIKLYKQGRLQKIKEKLLKSLESCNLCPRNCRVNRLKNEQGFCRTGRLAKVNSFFLHFNEESELVTKGGSGTIFFSFCNLDCLYCQNYNLSHLGEGREVDAYALMQMMLSLQRDGAENINFVTPTHVVAQILEGLVFALENGLDIPLVYNCSGYESTETLKKILGVFDIYMPDIKYSSEDIALKYSSAADYWEVAKTAVREMHRQVGDLVIRNKKAKRGLLIRHLVLPNRLAGSFKVLDFARELSLDTYINIMDQYKPNYRAQEFKELSRRINREEYLEVTDYAKKIGLYRGF